MNLIRANFLARIVPQSATRFAVRWLILGVALFPTALALGLTFTYGLVCVANWALTQSVLP